jgi:AcrR family transcriptional regulator
MSRDEQASATRRKLLNVAIALLCEGGMSAVTSIGVAARAGLTRGAVQHHFPNRTALLRAVVDNVTAELMALPVAFPGESVRDRIDAAIDRYWEYFGSTNYTAMVQLSLSDPNDAPVRGWVADEVERSQALLDRKWLDAFSDVGASRNRIHSARLLVMAALRGFAMLGYHRNREIDWTREVALLKEMLYAALTADAPASAARTIEGR